MTIDGTTALHVGDTQSDPRTWRGLGVPARGVDLALIPYWYALDDDRFRALLDVTAARAVVLLHAPLDRAESGHLKAQGGWEALSRGLRQRYGQVRIPVKPGEVLDFGP